MVRIGRRILVAGQVGRGTRPEWAEVHARSRTSDAYDGTSSASAIMR